VRIPSALFVAAVAGVLGSLATPLPARAQNDPPAAAQDDEPEKPVPPPDTGTPGPWIAYASRPALGPETKACSTRVPVCVHASAATRPRAVLDVVGAAERAWETLRGALRLAPPDVDPDELVYPVYLVDDASEPGATYVDARDVRSRIDRARGFTVLDANVRAGCILDALVARELARAALLRVAPATPAGIARAQTSYLAELVVPCAAALSAPAVAAFQSHPERAVCDARAGETGSAAEDGVHARTDALSNAFAEGAATFWSRIDWAYGRAPGSIVTASWALAPTMTDVGAARWHDEPDAFDVLRVSFKGALSTGSTLDDLLLDTAVARAFLGSADDGLHQVELRDLGDAARVALDWDLPWPARPVRVAPRAPVFPSGASYLVVRRAGAPPASRLRVEISWEQHALFRWAFVKLDAAGRELGRVPIPTRERATEAQMTLVDLEGVDRVLLVGVNVGDPSYRFDPDDEVWEPHSWLVTLASVDD
jgi:predicted RecA/RadA family phage recombinase